MRCFCRLGMLLNVVHHQVNKNIQQRKLKGFLTISLDQLCCDAGTVWDHQLPWKWSAIVLLPHKPQFLYSFSLFVYFIQTPVKLWKCSKTYIVGFAQDKTNAHRETKWNSWLLEFRRSWIQLSAVSGQFLLRLINRSWRKGKWKSLP